MRRHKDMRNVMPETAKMIAQPETAHSVKFDIDKQTIRIEQ